MNTCKALLLAAALAAGAAHAQAATPAAPTTASTADLTEGEVRKVDKENKKITLRHSDIKNLEMPGMTMVFQVPDAALLDKVKPGDKVRFRAEKDSGKLVVTKIEPAE